MNMNKQQLLQSLSEKEFSKEILNAFLKVKRENFIPEKMKKHAYEDTALSIGNEQTISQPYTIATMLSLLELKKNQKVLEIGSGCGYVLALISEIIGERGKVFGIEIIEDLAEKSKSNLKDYKNIGIHNRNGAFGLSKQAPFDRILISAGCQEIPKKISVQLKDNGILVAPVGSKHLQSLIAIQKIQDDFIIKEKLPGFIFVPFID